MHNIGAIIATAHSFSALPPPSLYDLSKQNKGLSRDTCWHGLCSSLAN